MLTDNINITFSPRAAAAEMARSPNVHPMEEAPVTPIESYKALAALASDDLPSELRDFAPTTLTWRQCPWNPDVLLAVLPDDVGVLVYHRWDGFNVEATDEASPVGMMDLRLTLNGAGKLCDGNIRHICALFKTPIAALMGLDASGDGVISRAVLNGIISDSLTGSGYQYWAGSDLLYALLLTLDGLPDCWSPLWKLFSRGNFNEVRQWQLSVEQLRALNQRALDS